MGKTAVLLLAHGTPAALEEIPAYLNNVTGGRPLPPEVVAEVTHRYGLVGHSPLTEITMAQGRLLERRLGVPVHVGMRNWRPYIADAVRRLREDGVTHVVALCLAPQNSQTSVGLYKRATFAEAGPEMRIDFVESWNDHPLLAEAFAERLRPALDEARRATGADVPVLFTAHSVPCRTMHARDGAAGDPYGVQARQTAALVAERCGLHDGDWLFAFQSQGMSGGPWIGPTVEDTLRALREEGAAGVVVQPVGFVCDHIEILYDIDIGFRSLADEIGLRLWRPESLNTSPTFVAALEDVVRGRLAGEALATATGEVVRG